MKNSNLLPEFNTIKPETITTIVIHRSKTYSLLQEIQIARETGQGYHFIIDKNHIYHAAPIDRAVFHTTNSCRPVQKSRILTSSDGFYGEELSINRWSIAVLIMEDPLLVKLSDLCNIITLLEDIKNRYNTIRYLCSHKGCNPLCHSTVHEDDIDILASSVGLKIWNVAKNGILIPPGTV